MESVLTKVKSTPAFKQNYKVLEGNISSFINTTIQSLHCLFKHYDATTPGEVVVVHHHPTGREAHVCASCDMILPVAYTTQCYSNHMTRDPYLGVV